MQHKKEFKRGKGYFWLFSVCWARICCPFVPITLQFFVIVVLIFYCPLIFFCPLHIKLSLSKQLVKALNKDSPVFSFLQSTFPSLSNAKIKEGVFIGPHIPKLFRNDAFDKMLNEDERTEWDCLKDVCQNFLGSHRADNYAELVTN